MFKSSFLLLSTAYMLSCSSGVSQEKEPEVPVQETVKSEFNLARDEETPQQQESSTNAALYHTVTLYGGNLKVAIPSFFTEMSAEKIAIKYPNKGNRPNVVYTSDDAKINVAFTKIELETTQNDLSYVQTVLSKQIQASKPERFVSRIENINGSNCIVFEFESKTIDTKIHNLMFATDLGGKLVVGNLNCTEDLATEWKPQALKILQSIKKSE